MDSLFSVLTILAHSFIGFYFVFFGIWNVYHWFPILETMTEKNIPHPYLVLPIGIAWEIIAGVMIICGIYVTLAAVLLIPFTIISVVMFHPFWKLEGERQISSLIVFITNITVTIGALLLLIGSG